MMLERHCCCRSKLEICQVDHGVHTQRLHVHCNLGSAESLIMISRVGNQGTEE